MKTSVWKAPAVALCGVFLWKSDCIPVLPRVSEDPWKLLVLASSQRKKTRIAGLRGLSSLPLSDWMRLEICQAADIGTLVQLSRLGFLASNDLYRFDPETQVKGNVEEALRNVLKLLLPTLNDDSVRYCTEEALFGQRTIASSYSAEDEMYGDFDEETNAIAAFYNARPDTKRLLLCLEALALQSTITSQCTAMVGSGVIELLHKVWHEHAEKKFSSIRILTLKTLANIACCDKNGCEAIVKAGWLQLLRPHFVQSSDIKNQQQSLDLSMLTVKLFANLDSTLNWNGSLSYPDGVYLLHPPDYGLSTSRSECAAADLVFVHGLRGGVVRTWRQKDAAPPPSRRTLRRETNDLPAELKNVGNSRTQCWPRDWLPSDLSRPVRIIGIDYASSISDWGSKPPGLAEKYTLTERSKELREKLRRCDVGGRPIIWLSHSMGGLIVKRVLADCQTSPFQNSDEKIISKTVACAFLSTPHFGSPLADQTLTARYRLEVRELQKNRYQLLRLNEQFSRIVMERNLHIISLAETRKTVLRMAGVSMPVEMVPVESANPGYGEFVKVDENHLNTCKPEHRTSAVYRTLLEFVRSNLN